MSLTKQDIQNIVENAKNRIMERGSTKQDVQTLTEAARDRIIIQMQELISGHHQQILSRDNFRQSQTVRRIVNLEAKIVGLEHEIKLMRGLLEQVATAQQRPVHLSMQPAESQSENTTSDQYIYYST